MLLNWRKKYYPKVLEWRRKNKEKISQYNRAYYRKKKAALRK